MSSDINVQTFSGKVNITSNLLVGSSHFFVDTLGNKVGINTSSPSASLDIATGDLKVGSGITLGNSGTITAANFNGNGSGLSGINSDSGSWINGTNSNVHLATLTDKVGIATATPMAKLDIEYNAAAPAIVFSDTTNSRYQTGIGSLHVSNEGQRLDFYTGDSEANGTLLTNTPRMCITGTGNVGIGKMSPTAQLHISSGNSGDCVLKIEADEDNNDETDNPRIEFITDGGYNTALVGAGQMPFEISNDNALVLAALQMKFYTGVQDFTDSTNMTEKMRILANGNVGIGTTAPGEKLHVNGNFRLGSSLNNTVDDDANHSIATAGQLTIISNDSGLNSSYVNLVLQSGKTNPGKIVIGGGDIDVYRDIEFYTSGSSTERMRIHHDGNVGIGTSSPEEKLDVSGNMVVRGSGTTAQRFDVKTDTANHVIAGNWYSSSHSLSLVSAGSININVDYNANDLNKNIDFRTNTSTDGGTLLMRVNEGGGVFIGDQAPNGTVTYVSAQLALAGTHNEGYNRSGYVKLLIAGGNNDGGSPYYIMCEDENGYEQMWVKGATSDGGGNAQLYIKGECKMQSAGDSYAYIPGNDGWLRLQGAASGQGNLYGSYTSLAVGNFYAAGATRFSSDDRVKHFEEEIPNALELIQQLKPYKYKKTSKIYDEDYTGDIGEDWEWEIGLIAQDVEKIPYLEHTVSKPENGAEEKYGLNYTQFIGVCIQGIKDMDRDLQSEKEKVRNLESRVALFETYDIQTELNKTREDLKLSKTEHEITKLKLNTTEARLEIVEQTLTSILSKLSI